MCIRRANSAFARIGIADRNTLAGVVRAYNGARQREVSHKPKLLIGARIVFVDGTPDILVYPRDRAAYGRLCQLLTRGKRGDGITRIEKGECHLRSADLLEFCRRPAPGAGAAASLRCRRSAQKMLEHLSISRADGVWLAASLLYRGDDSAPPGAAAASSLRGKSAAARDQRGAVSPSRPPAAAGRADLYPRENHHRRHRQASLQANAERHLKPPARNGAAVSRMCRRRSRETMRFAAAHRFSLDQLKYQYPDEPVPPGKTAQQHLEDLTWAGVDTLFPKAIDR